MRYCTLIAFLIACQLNAQFTQGHDILRNENTGTYYVITLSGQIWVDQGAGYVYAGLSAGANVGQAVLIQDKLYVARINKIKVYDLDPVALDTTWDVPAGEWLIGLAWDGGSTLYANDTQELFQVDMTTGSVASILDDYQGSTPGRMIHDPLGDRLLFLEHGTGIWSYDLLSGTYGMLHAAPFHRLNDFVHACNDKWMLAVEFNQGGGMLFNIPEDFSAPGDTAYASNLIDPRAVYYDAAGDSALYVEYTAVAVLHDPCATFIGINELESGIGPSILQGANGAMVRWPVLPLNGNTRLRITDATGRTITEETLQSSQLIAGHPLHLKGGTGVYVVTLINGGTRTSLRVVPLR